MSSARKCRATQVEDAVDAHLTLSAVDNSRVSHFLPMKDGVGPQRLTFSTNDGILNGKFNLLTVSMRRNSKNDLRSQTQTWRHIIFGRVDRNEGTYVR